MNTATIFYNNEKRFDCRFDAQILPADSIVAGFMVWQGIHKPISELLDPPAMNPEQEAQFQSVCEEARTTLNA